MAKLSNADQTYLSREQQEQIKALKAQYAAAQTDEERNQIHADAEKIRANAASGGYATDASGQGYQKLAAKENGGGGSTAEQVRQYLDDYNAANWNPNRGWINGYDVSTNTRAKANYVRQQMEANSKAWHTATDAEKAYLHDQNLELADILAQYTGHGINKDEDGKVRQSASYGYDEKTGQWWTRDANNGYGTYIGYDQPNVRKSLKEAYGYTDQQMDDWAKNRSSLYYNFVDAKVPARNQVNESSGFSGRYAPFQNGAHLALVGTGTSNANRANYADLIGDGFHDENDYAAQILPEYDSEGNIIKTETPVKPNGLSDYTRQFTAYTQNGLIMPNSLQVSNPGNAKAVNGAYTGALRENGTGGLEDDMKNYVPNVNDGNKMDEQQAYIRQMYATTGMSPQTAAQSAGAYRGSTGSSSLIEQMYGATLEAQKAALESAYQSNLDQLDTSEGKMVDAYTEQRRQTTGQSAQDAAAWRELANAYGLNSGAIGQGALAQSNQLQTNLGAINSQQAATLEQLEQQRITLGKEYQLAIQQATAENNFQKAQALYQEAVRAEQQLIQQMQFAAQMSMQQQQLDAQNAQWAAEFAAKQAAANAAASTGGGSSPVMLAEDLYTKAYLSGNPDSYMKKQGVDKSHYLYEGYDSWLKNMTASGTMANSNMDKLASYASVVYNNTGQNADYLVSLLRKQGYSDNAIDLAMARIGL